MTDVKAMTLLLVDDSRVARMSLIRQLKALPIEFDIIQADCADQAQEVMQDKQADVAFIDFNMPGRDGIALAEEFIESHPDMKLALVTANIQQPLMDRAKALGMAFLSKPACPDALASFLGVAP